MKIVEKIFLIAFLLLCKTLVYAHDFEIDGIYYNILSETDLTVEVTYNDSSEYNGIVTIPKEVIFDHKKYTVSSIGESTFYGSANLKNVTIPNSITHIGNHAFSECN